MSESDSQKRLAASSCFTAFKMLEIYSQNTRDESWTILKTASLIGSLIWHQTTINFWGCVWRISPLLTVWVISRDWCRQTQTKYWCIDMGILRSISQKKYVLLSKTSETSKYHLELNIVYISDKMSNMSRRSLENFQQIQSMKFWIIKVSLMKHDQCSCRQLAQILRRLFASSILD